MKLDTFKKIYQEVTEFEKHGASFEVRIINDDQYSNNNGNVDWTPRHFSAKTISQMAALQDKVKGSIALNDTYNKIRVNFQTNNCNTKVSTLWADFTLGKEFKSNYPTLKFYSDILRSHIVGIEKLYCITETPHEATENGVTYRYVGNEEICNFCVPHTHPLYNYLDKGFFFIRLADALTTWDSLKESQKEGPGVIIANELTVDVLLIICLILTKPELAKELPNQCFINAATAKVTRVKLEKMIPDREDMFNYTLKRYFNCRELLLKEYEKNVNAGILQKIIDKKVPHASYNGIKLYNDKAVYENISIEYTDLVKILQTIAVFDERTDIYSLVRDFVQYTVKSLEYTRWLTEDKTEIVYNFKINEININLKRTSDNSRRTINNKHINIAELEEVLCQATCYNSEDEYNKFVKAVSKMSLKFHKAIANGIPVKIIDTLTYEDYRKPEAPACAPKIRFKKEDNKYKLIISPTENVPIKLNSCISKLAQINRKTNGGWGRYSGRRDYQYARNEVIQALILCCTFEEEDTVTTTESVMLTDQDGNYIRKDDGTFLVETKEVTRKQKVTKNYLTNEQAAFICREAEQFQKKALEKSKIFLETAIKCTNATKVSLDHQPGYMVEGKTKRYFVNEKTNTVHDYDTKAYICIVEQGHQIQLGYDALAARLYALKNDSVMAQQISTLRKNE